MDRYSTLAAWADVTAAFALGAAIACVVAEAIERNRHVPGPISDDIVRQRVRERVMQLVSRPDAIDVTVEEGVVRLAGGVLPEERDVLLHGVVDMPGVWRVRNALAIMEADR
jgi:osmotically-inducible protein OsmY